MYMAFFAIFYALCTLTGQLPIKLTKEKENNENEDPRNLRANQKGSLKLFLRWIAIILTTIVMGAFVLVNIGSLVFDLYVIIWCPYKHCGYISLIRNTSIFNLTNSENRSNSSELQVVQVANLTIFEDWQKTVLTTATASGTISYLFMTYYVLYSQYSVFKDIICDKGKDCTQNMWGKCGENLAEKSLGVLKSLFKR